MAVVNHSSVSCTAPGTSLSQAVLRLVQISFSGLSLSSSSMSSKVPMNTATWSLKSFGTADPSTVLHMVLLQLSQKKVCRSIPFSCFSVCSFASPARTLNCGLFTKTAVELVLPVVLWQAKQWQRIYSFGTRFSRRRGGYGANASIPHLLNWLASVLVFDLAAMAASIRHFQRI